MDARVDNPADESIGELFSQLVGDGRNAVRAEIDLYKTIAGYRIGKAKSGVIALAAAGFLAYAGLIAALVGFVLGLAPLVGPVIGGIIVLAVTGLIAFLLLRFGISKLGALSGDADEKAALAAGETLA